MVFPWFSRLEHRSGILQELRDAELRQALGHAAQQLRGLSFVGAVAGGHPGEMAIVYWKTWENIEKYRRIW